MISRCVAVKITGQKKLTLNIPGNPTIFHNGGSPTVIQVVVRKEEIEDLRKLIADQGLGVEIFFQEPAAKKKVKS